MSRYPQFFCVSLTGAGKQVLTRRQMHSEIVSTRRFLGMAQPAKPLIVLHAGTNDPMPKRQILRNRGRMWKR